TFVDEPCWCEKLKCQPSWRIHALHDLPSPLCHHLIGDRKCRCGKICIPCIHYSLLPATKGILRPALINHELARCLISAPKSRVPHRTACYHDVREQRTCLPKERNAETELPAWLMDPFRLQRGFDSKWAGNVPSSFSGGVHWSKQGAYGTLRRPFVTSHSAGTVMRAHLAP